MEELDMWLLKLENSNKNKSLPNKLFKDIRKFIQDAFVYDFNMIIEEFDFYFWLPPLI